MRPFAARQRRQEGMGDVEDAVEVDRDDVLPILDHGLVPPVMPLRRAMPALLTRIETGRPCRRPASPSRRQSSRRVTSSAKAVRLAAGLADLFRGLGGRFLVHVEQHDARALACIARRDRAADAGAGAGDDGDVILQKGHGVSFWFCLLRWASVAARARFARSCSGRPDIAPSSWRLADGLMNGAAVPDDTVMRRRRIASAAYRCRRNRCWR